jgi:phage-related protein (TIGR01555 family)
LPPNLRVVHPSIPAFEDAVARNSRRLNPSRALVARSRRKPTQDQGAVYERLFAPAKPYPGVLPQGAKPRPTMAFDQTTLQVSAWGQQWAAASSLVEGQGFIGYPALSEFAQRAEYRAITETLAYEMTREGVKFTSSGKEDKTERIKKLEELVKRFKVLDVLRVSATHDGFFGRGHIFVDTVDVDFDEPLDEQVRQELRSSIGNGRSTLSANKVDRGSLRRFVNVEPVWTYPTRYNSNNPLSASWYKPTHWFVMGVELHESRLLTLVGREVPDMLKPAYSFGGLSMTQMAMPYVQNWLRTRQAVADLVWSFSVFVLKTNLSESMQVDGEALFNRAELFNNLRNNQGLMLLDKDLEDFMNVSASIGGLEGLQAQAQEHMAAVSRVPLVKLLGIQPAGLNASSEGEIRTFYDWIHAFQEKLFREPLERMLRFIQLSEFGDVDPDIHFDFASLWQLDEAGKMAVLKEKADIDDANIAMGKITPEEARKREASDEDGIYQGLDLDEPIPQPDDDMVDPETGLPYEDPQDPQHEQGAGGEQLHVQEPRDPANRLASSVANKGANFGGIESGGFKTAAE